MANVSFVCPLTAFPAAEMSEWVYAHCSAAGWRPAGKPRFEVVNLQRSLKNSTVPMPKTLLRMILNATLPRLIQRALLVALPPELGQYLLACKQGIHIAGAAAVQALHETPLMPA